MNRETDPASAPAPAAETHAASWSLSLVRNDPLYRLQRKIGLIPENGLGIVRRMLFWTLFAWLPTALWAWHVNHLLPGTISEPLLGHFGINARLLVAVPLFILGEGLVHATLTQQLPRLITSGLVPPAQHPALRAILTDTARLRDALLPWVAMAGLIVVFFVFGTPGHTPHELSWAGTEGEATPRIGFGGWWYLYVGRTVFLTLLLAWLWRTLLFARLLMRIARLPLALVPTHPDRCGGLEFLGRLPIMFAPLVLGIFSVFASSWAHQLVYHEVPLAALRIEIAAFVVLAPALFVLPFLPFMGVMLRAKKDALRAYGELIAHHGRLVHARWIEKKEVPEQPLLDAPELGPVADIVAPYELISAMRPLPLALPSLLPLLAAALVPMIVLASIQMPIQAVLKGLLKMLV